MEVFIRDEEFNKLVDNAEWIPDCQDKWNLDFNILSVDTRMWGNQGGMLCFGDGKFEEIKEEKASAKTTITFGEQVILESPYIYGKNNDECKQNVKDWLKLNYKNIFKNFIEQHDTELQSEVEQLKKENEELEEYYSLYEELLENKGTEADNINLKNDIEILKHKNFGWLRIQNLEKEVERLKHYLAIKDMAYKLLLEWTIKNANELMKNEVINGFEDAFEYSFIEQAEKALKDMEGKNERISQN